MCLAQGPQRSDAGEARTRCPSVSSQALYHWATALPLWSKGLRMQIISTRNNLQLKTPLCWLKLFHNKHNVLFCGTHANSSIADPEQTPHNVVYVWSGSSVYCICFWSFLLKFGGKMKNTTWNYKWFWNKLVKPMLLLIAINNFLSCYSLHAKNDIFCFMHYFNIIASLCSCEQVGLNMDLLETRRQFFSGSF